MSDGYTCRCTRNIDANLWNKQKVSVTPLGRIRSETVLYRHRGNPVIVKTVAKHGCCHEVIVQHLYVMSPVDRTDNP